MRGSYDYDKLEKLKNNLPANIEFSIYYRKGEDDIFSVKKGKIDLNVLAIVDTLADKMFYEVGDYQVPLTKNGYVKYIPDGCIYLVDSLFHAVQSVFYDDKSCAWYEVDIDESKLTEEGKAVLSSLRKSDYQFELDIMTGYSDEYVDGYALSGTIA